MYVYIYIHIYQNLFPIHLKLTHCTSTILQKQFFKWLCREAPKTQCTKRNHFCLIYFI